MNEDSSPCSVVHLQVPSQCLRDWPFSSNKSNVEGLDWQINSNSNTNYSNSNSDSMEIYSHSSHSSHSSQSNQSNQSNSNNNNNNNNNNNCSRSASDTEISYSLTAEFGRTKEGDFEHSAPSSTATNNVFLNSSNSHTSQLNKLKTVEVKIFSDKKWFINDDENTKKIVAYQDVINFPEFSSSRCRLSGACSSCVMCGKSDSKIPTQNKNICNICDSSFWLRLENDVVIKYCKGCKNFLVLNDFGAKPKASKCNYCRQRGRQNYFSKKKLEGDSEIDVEVELSANICNKRAQGDDDSKSLDIISSASSPTATNIHSDDNRISGNITVTNNNNDSNSNSSKSNSSSSSSSSNSCSNNNIGYIEIKNRNENNDTCILGNRSIVDNKRNETTESHIDRPLGKKMRKGEISMDLQLLDKSFPIVRYGISSEISSNSSNNENIDNDVFVQYKYSAPCCSTPFHRIALKRRNSLDSAFSGIISPTTTPLPRSNSFDDVSDSNIVFWSLSSSSSSSPTNGISSGAFLPPPVAASSCTASSVGDTCSSTVSSNRVGFDSEAKNQSIAAWYQVLDSTQLQKGSTRAHQKNS